jgi:hypothetical protein
MDGGKPLGIMKQYYPLWSMARLSGRDSKPTDISGWAKYIGD